jgi:hypothetical protein
LEGKISDLPPERQSSYNRKRRPLILRYKLSGHRTKGSLRVD